MSRLKKISLSASEIGKSGRADLEISIICLSLNPSFDYESAALPTELSRLTLKNFCISRLKARSNIFYDYPAQSHQNFVDLDKFVLMPVNAHNKFISKILLE